MNEEKRISEREAVKRERAAFKLGARWLYAQRETPDDMGKYVDTARQDEAVADLLPLPKVERPRVVTLSSKHGPLHLRIVDGCKEFCFRGEGPPTADRYWHPFHASLCGRNESITSTIDTFIIGYAELFARPTEAVEDDS